MDKKTLGVAALAFLAGAAVVFVITRVPGPWAPDMAQMPAADTPAEEADDAKNPVVAVIDGHQVRLADLDAFKELMPQQYRSLPTEMIFAPLLEQVITSRLLVGAGRKAGLQANTDVRKRLVFLEDRLVQNAYLTQLTQDAQTKHATDAEIERRYKVFLENVKPQVEVHARHILLKTKEEAVSIIETLDGGADFVEVAKNNSTGPSAERGGDLGYFTQADMVPEFSDAAFKLDKGTYTAEPVQTQFGWHVIKVEDKREKPAPTLDETKGRLVEEITREYILAAIDRLRGEVRVERFNVDGTPVTADTNGEGEEKSESDGETPAETEAKPADATEDKPAEEKGE